MCDGKALLKQGFMVFVLLVTDREVTNAITSDVLWQSCNTTICGRPALSFRCEISEKILINNVPSTSGTEVNRQLQERSYMNLRRMCMGMSACEPERFCETHSVANNGQMTNEFNVNYVCVRDADIIKKCEPSPVRIKDRQGFITSPQYPSETQFRTCKWEIKVPKHHYVHIYLHEILLTAGKDRSNANCDGVIFMTKATCAGKPFPTYALCDVNKVNSSITACGDVTIFLSGDNPDPMRFWFSFYVVPVDDLRYVILYNRGLTCTVTAKPSMIYSSIYLSGFNKTGSEDDIFNTTEVSLAPSNHGNEKQYDLYIGLAALGVFLIAVFIIVQVYLRKCRGRGETQLSHKSSLSNSNSQTNCSEIQKRPLPEAAESTDEGQPFLQQGYSVVADEIPRALPPSAVTSPTYAEIDECNESGEKQKPKPNRTPGNKRSLVDNSKRRLPAKPVEDDGKAKIYYEIDDAAKDASTEKSSLGNKNKKTTNDVKQPEKNLYGYKYEKKLSNASNIYAECEDVQNHVNDKAYMDMTHKQEGDYVPFSKNTKDKVNQTKRILRKDKPNSPKQNSPYVDCSNLKRPSDFKKVVAPRAKNESLSSDSDSDDISMVENELYEPFESAKV